MSFEIPARIEQEVEQYAEREHLTRDEAVVQLIEGGLRRQDARPLTPAEEGRGMFSSPEDAALMDYVIQVTYESRGYIPRGTVKD